ncbi:MAG TPA: hypothetical protein VMJ10_36025 [Kofleriaceae bacterium]|nr:hypothetical protein [Kofleriaceae bacterium]
MARGSVLVLLCMLAACSDVRDFRGTWTGPRVGEASVLRVGIADNATATLVIADVDTHQFSGTIAVDGVVALATPVASMPAAEADVLATTTWSGSPLHVYFGFFAVPDGHGDALAVVALYDDRRVELRVLRGGTLPLYGIFALAEGSP